MKKQRERSFGSVDEIVKTYMPDYKSGTESRAVDDPAVAGELLAKRLVNTIRGEMSKRRQRT